MGPKSCILVCLLFAAFFCSLINSQAEDEEYAQSEEESYDQEKPLTAADQYLNFIASGGKSTDDIVPEEFRQDEGAQERGYGPGQDLDHDYGTETLNLLLSKTILEFFLTAPWKRTSKEKPPKKPVSNIALT